MESWLRPAIYFHPKYQVIIFTDCTGRQRLGEGVVQSISLDIRGDT